MCSTTGGPGDGSNVYATITGDANYECGKIAPISNSWAAIGSKGRWYAYPDTVNASTQFVGVLVTPGYAPTGSGFNTILDIAPIGRDYTAVLYNSFTNGLGATNTAVAIWANTNLSADTYLRVINVVYNGGLTNIFSASRIAGPLEVHPIFSGTMIKSR